jgi:sugar phosphate isomerase/epimerase
MNPLSINAYICPEDMSVEALFPLAVAAGASAVGLTVRAVDEIDHIRLRSFLNDNGLAVSSLNSAGYFLYEDPAALKQQRERNQRLIDLAAQLQAHTLVVITGGLAHGTRSLGQARACIAEGLAELAEQAADAGVHLGLEPIHPAGVLNKGCINSLQQALALIGPLSGVSLTLDLYHSWWDTDLEGLAARAGDKVRLVQFSNVVALRDPADFQREEPANGLLDVGQMLRALAVEGYRGYFEFELFADHLRGRSPERIIEQVGAFYARLKS